MANPHWNPHVTHTLAVCRPLANLSQPLANLSQPLANLSKPLANLSQPLAKISQPLANLSQPLAGALPSTHGEGLGVGSVISFTT